MRGLRDDGGVTEEEKSGVVPRGWRDRTLRPEEVSAWEKSDREVLAAHLAETITPTKPPKKTRKAGQPGALLPVRYISGQTPHLCAPAGGGRPFRGQRDPRMRKSQATEPVRTRTCRVVTGEAGGRSTDHTSPGVPVRRSATSGNREALGGDAPLLWCSGRQYATCTSVPPRRRAAKPTPAAGPRDLLRMFVRHQVETGAPFNAGRDLRKDIGIERGGLRDASASEFRHKSILVDATYARLCAGSADQDGSAAYTSEPGKRNHYARPGHVSFDKRNHNFVTTMMERFGRLGREGSEIIDQPATSVVGGRDGGAKATEGICTGRLVQIRSSFSDPSNCDLTPPAQARGTGPSRDYLREEEGRLLSMAWGWHVDAG